MKFSEFKRRLKEVSACGVLLGSMEPVMIPKRIAINIVQCALEKRPIAMENGFSGRIFVSIIPLGIGGGVSMLIGVPSDFDDAEEVKP